MATKVTGHKCESCPAPATVYYVLDGKAGQACDECFVKRGKEAK